MHSRLLVSGLPRSLPPLPPSPAPPCLPCVEGWQRAAPHSFSFPPMTAPLQTLHMDVWGPACVSGRGHERYFLLVVDDHTRYTTVFPLRSKGQVVDVLIPWIRAVRLQLRERFCQDLPVQRLHPDRGGQFSSDLLRQFCHGEGILQSFTLPASPQQNGIAERRIGLVMEFARTSMIHAAAPHFLWLFAVRYVAHQLNLWPRVSLPKTSPTLRWTGQVGDASVFRVWGSRAFVRDTSTDKLSARAIPCVFLGIPPDVLGWQFYHPTSRRVFPSHDITFDESVSFYCLFPYRSVPPPPPPLFLAPSPPPVDPLPPQGPASSGVSQVDPLPGTVPVEVAGDSGAARGTASGGAEPGGAESEGAGSWGAEPGGAEPGVAEPAGAEPRGAEPGGPGVPGTLLSKELLGLEAQELEALALVALELEELELEALARDELELEELELEELELEALEMLTLELEVLVELVPEALCGSDCTSFPCFSSPTVSRLLATAIIDPSFESTATSALVAGLVDFAAACRLGYVTALVAESSTASPPSVEAECALGLDVLEDKQEDFECLAAAVPCFASILLAPEGDPDAPDIPTPRSYAKAIPGTYVDVVPPSRANIVDGMWIFRVKRPPGSLPPFKARYVARCFSQRQGVDYFQTFSPTPKMITLRVLLHVAGQRDYELHSLDFNSDFLRGSPHEEIWLRRPPGFTGSFLAGTQTTLAALGFTPTADTLLFLCTDTLLPPFYVLVYVDDLVFATTVTEALTLVKSELPKRHTCTDLGEMRSNLGLQITRDRARRTITLTQSNMVHQVLQRFDFLFSSPQPTPLSTSHSLSAPPSNESVEPGGPYPELVGCLITSGMGLVLGGWGLVVLTGHANASWVDDSATQRSSQGYNLILRSGSVSWRSTRLSSVLSFNCEAEIYTGAMAAQELRWLTYLLIDLGEQPRSPPILYVNNKAMIALRQEHRLEHRTKHIALRYFIGRELQQHGQLRLAYVATRANSADIFTKAIPPGDHQRFSTVLGLVPTLPHSLTA
ncbi:unnamed protein product [Closterium sp. NIES-54]